MGMELIGVHPLGGTPIDSGSVIAYGWIWTLNLNIIIIIKRQESGVWKINAWAGEIGVDL